MIEIQGCINFIQHGGQIKYRIEYLKIDSYVTQTFRISGKCITTIVNVKNT